jgi:TP901 family phage tail tape measure protein
MARVGGALTFLGTAITTLGIQMAQEFGEMTMEAVEFGETAALAFTQMFEKGSASIEDIGDAMKSVGREVPAEIGQMGDAMFDIFSSLDATVPEGEELLRKFSEAAVAGQTDIRSAAIPTIATMNAFGLAVEDVDRIQDLQFKTVQKGILTYGEYTSSIGKVIPAAKSAGQDLETMGGVMAFLTRNGLSAAMASTSAARAFELFADPKSVKNLEEAGIAVRDEAGEFRQINDVLADMSSIFGDLTAPERKEKFKELFGTGRIQARRFFDIAIPNWEDLNDLVGEFGGSAGAMQEAYDIMFNTPAAQLDLLRNRWEILRIEIGEEFIPVLTEKLIPALDKVFDYWESLDDEQKANFATMGAWASIGTTVFGVLTAFAGAATLAAAIWKGFGKQIVGLVATGGRFLGWIGLIAGAAYLIWQNWDTLVAFWNNTMVPMFKSIWQLMNPEAIGKAWDKLKTTFVKVWNKIKGAALDAWDRIKRVFGPDMPKQLRKIWEKFKDFWKSLWRAVGGIIEAAIQVIRGLVEGVVAFWMYLWEWFGDDLIQIAKDAWDGIVDIFSAALDFFSGIFDFIRALIDGDWAGVWQAFVDIVRAIWDALWALVTSGLQTLWDLIKGLGEWFIEQVWSPLWEGIKTVGEAIWNGLVSFFTAVWEGIVTVAVTIWSGLKDFFVGLWNAVYDFIKNIWDSQIVKFFRDIWGIIQEIFRIAAEIVLAVIIAAFEGAWEFIQIIWDAITTFLGLVWDGLVIAAETAWNLIKDYIIGPMQWMWDNILRPLWDEIVRVLGGIWYGIQIAASIAWNLIKDYIINPIITAYNTVTGWIGDLLGWLSEKWSDLSTGVSETWTNFKETILGAVGEVWTGFTDFLGDIGGWFSDLWDTATEWVEKIRNVLSKINPLEWFSPPITVQVAGGFGALETIVSTSLSNMLANSDTLVTNFRKNVTTMSELYGKQVDLANAPTPTTSFESTAVTVTTAASDPAQISDELAWRLRHL